MIELRYEVKAYDVNGDDVLITVQIESVLNADAIAAAGSCAIEAGLLGVGAIAGPPAPRQTRDVAICSCGSFELDDDARPAWHGRDSCREPSTRDVLREARP